MDTMKSETFSYLSIGHWILACGLEQLLLDRLLSGSPYILLYPSRAVAGILKEAIEHPATSSNLLTMPLVNNQCYARRVNACWVQVL